MLNFIFDFFKSLLSLGSSDSIDFNIGSEDPYILLFSSILIFSVLSFIGLLQIVFYIITIYLLDNKYLYDKLVEYLPSFLIKGLNYYKNISFTYLVIDFIFIFLSLGYIIWLSAFVLMYK